ncbi:unnamed protein product, partial [Aphanomyces euteiches]
MDLESQYERYDLSLAAVAEGAQDQFDPVDNADEFQIATFFPGVPMRGLMHYPPVVDFAQVSSVQRRLKKMLQRGSALEDRVAVALVLLRHMHALGDALSNKSDSAFYKTFNTLSGLVEDIAQFASARLNAPRLHYAVVRDLVMTLARPRFTEEVMAQT